MVPHAGLAASPARVTTDKSRAVRPRLGALSTHLRDILGLPPEVMRVDLVSVPVTIGADGAMAQPPMVSLHADYASELFAIAGFVQNPTIEPHLAPLVRFNAREDGRNFDIFSTDVEMSYLVSSFGPGHKLEFPRGAYVFRPGARVKVRFSIDPAYVNEANETKRWGVMLLLNLWRSK